MFNNEYAIFLGVGILFVIFGIVAIVWGRAEVRRYYNSLSSRRDVREFMIRWPPRAGLDAVQIGGWIALAVGLVLLIVGAVIVFKP